MGTKARLRREAVANGEQGPHRDPVTTTQIFRCGKCHHIVLESCVTTHLIKCQPNGAVCGKCNTTVPPAEFIHHFNNCKGTTIIEDDGNIG